MYILKLNKQIELHPGQNIDPAEISRTRVQDTWCFVAFLVENLQDNEKKIVLFSLLSFELCVLLKYYHSWSANLRGFRFSLKPRNIISNEIQKFHIVFGPIFKSRIYRTHDPRKFTRSTMIGIQE
jgi:hypothetical protein